MDDEAERLGGYQQIAISQHDSDFYRLECSSGEKTDIHETNALNVGSAGLRFDGDEVLLDAGSDIIEVWDRNGGPLEIRP